MQNATEPTTIELTLTLEEYSALMFAMQAWATTVANLPLIPEGVERGTVVKMRRNVFDLNDRIQKLGEMYGLTRP